LDRRRPPVETGTTFGSGMFAATTGAGEALARGAFARGAFARTTGAFARTTGAAPLTSVDDAAPISIIGRESAHWSKVDRLKARPQMKAR